MRGSSDLIELSGDDLRRDPLDVRNANAVGLGVAALISTGLSVHKATQGSVSAQRSVSCIIAPQL
jgi:hypothetical protein